ncbi:MAG TPA: glycosyl hydrolase 108 family protein [Luteimonas sp.]|nr:glycosyl hydrolase 108 family protein [Luteimonas sp.]
MNDTFATFIDRVLSHEGGYVFDKRDPGGETQWGISKRSYPALNIKALTRDQAVAIYRRDFWDAQQCDKLPKAVAFQLLDAVINHGAGNAVRWLQAAAGVVADGAIGPLTLAAARRADPNDLLLRFNAARLEFYASLKTFDHFGRGWTRRVAANLRFAAGDN